MEKILDEKTGQKLILFYYTAYNRIEKSILDYDCIQILNKIIAPNRCRSGIIYECKILKSTISGLWTHSVHYSKEYLEKYGFIIEDEKEFDNVKNHLEEYKIILNEIQHERR